MDGVVPGRAVGDGATSDLASILQPSADPRADFARLADEVRSFLAELPARSGGGEPRGVREALRSLLQECGTLAARNPGGVPFQLHSTVARVRRIRGSADPAAAVERERLDVPIANFGVVEEGLLYRGAQPSRNGLAWLAGQGVRTVVTLRPSGVEDGYGYVDFDSSGEAEACRRLGMRSVSIPVPDLGLPTAEQVDRFLSVVGEEGPVFVHCAGGVGRTGVMAAAWQRWRGVALEDVLGGMRRHGLDGSVDWARRQMDFVRGYRLPPEIGLTVLHTGDLHGQFLPSSGVDGARGGLAYLAATVEAARTGREDRTLLVDAGDSLAGSGLSAALSGRPVVEAMNAMGYDFATLGNHDFNWRKPVLQETLEAARFDVVDTNVRDLETGGTFLHEDVPGAVVGRRLVAGVRVGVVGLTTPDARLTENQENLEGLAFEDPVKAARAAVAELKSWGADLILVLSHLGLEADRELARRVPGIHVVLGGHTHLRLERPVREGDTTIVQAGSHASDLGRLDVVLDAETKAVRRVDYRLIPVRPEEVRPDPRVQAIVDRCVREADAVRRRPVGALLRPLGRSGGRDSPLGNLVADAFRQAAGADVALVNSGFLRADLPAGPITAGHLLDALPFEARVVTVRMRGDTLRQVLERSLAAADPYREKSNLLQVSGLRVVHAGGRLREARVGTEPLDLRRTYSVATIDFLARGGLGYEGLAAAGPGQETGLSAREAVSRCLAGGWPGGAPASEGRIVDASD